MELGDKLEELNLTADELSRLSKAFKDDKFKEMLRDYAQEISDPVNRKKYEEEMKLLEQQRGNTIEFIHPTPFKAIKTSVGGKQKCFINICTNDKVGKPESKSVVSEDGRRGQCWSLPHSLHPGRQDTDAKGNKFMIYDVIYHPDTLYIACRDKKFMDIVDDTAIQGIQKAFKVTLDKNNVKEIKTKYKGISHPCVFRKPIPGYKAKEAPEQPDPLAFPFPDDTQMQTKPVLLPATENSNNTEPKNYQVQLPQTKEPTKPNYTVKYRSFIDLQDFRCSRDSAQSPRPKEIVVTIDMPLLKSVANTILEVKEKSLLLESKTPAYRLELPLAYPVEEDKGQAKFIKQRRQLIITLPVHPINVAFDFCDAPATSLSDFQSDGEKQEQKSGVEKDVKWEEREQEAKERHMEENMMKVNKHEEEEENDQRVKAELCEKTGEVEETGEEERKIKQLEQKGQEGNEEERIEVQKRDKIPERKMQEQDVKLQENKINKDEGGQVPQTSKQNENTENNNPSKPKREIWDKSAEKDSCVLEQKAFTEETAIVVHNRAGASLKPEQQHILIYDQHCSHTGQDKEGSLPCCLESAQMKTNSTQETRKTKIIQENMQMRTDATLLKHTSNEGSPTTADTAATKQRNEGDGCVSDCEGVKSSNVSTADAAETSSSGSPGGQLTLCSAKPTPVSIKRSEDTDEDDLPVEQTFQTPELNKPPPILREINADGKETVISHHSTSAGFLFQNTLMYELD